MSLTPELNISISWSECFRRRHIINDAGFSYRIYAARSRAAAKEDDDDDDTLSGRA